MIDGQRVKECVSCLTAAQHGPHGASFPVAWVEGRGGGEQQSQLVEMDRSPH